MSAPKSWAGMLQWSAGLLERRTGAGVAEWNERVRQAGIDSELELRAWLAEHGVTGYPQMLLVMERFGLPGLPHRHRGRADRRAVRESR